MQDGSDGREFQAKDSGSGFNIYIYIYIYIYYIL